MSALRLANVVFAGTPVFALEHRGELWSVPVLEQRMALESSPVRFSERACEFQQRVFSLGMTALDELLDCLGDEDGPKEAWMDPRLCMYLPPTVPSCALLEFSALAGDAIPRFKWGNGRCLRGHEAPLPLPPDEVTPQVSVEVAAILGEDVKHASPLEAERAIAGFAPLCLWTFPSRDRVSPGWGAFRLGQLGPVLVVPHSDFDPSACEVTLRVNGQRVVHALGKPWKVGFPEMISFASEAAELLAGDVIASGPLVRTSSDGLRSLRDDDVVSAEIASLGTLAGTIVTSGKPSRFLR